MKIPFDKLDKIYITSDTHFGHKNICRGVSEWSVSEHASGNELPTRDFQTLEEMNRAIIDGINSIVPKDGILFHLGDWSFGGEPNIALFRQQLNVETIHVITGNHDHHIEKPAQNGANGICKWDYLFTTRQKYLELEIGKMGFCLFHFPIQSWNNVNRGWFHLHGHQHWKGDLRFGNGKMMDVGMDGNDLKPYKLADVADLLKDRRKVDENDHHTK